MSEAGENVILFVFISSFVSFGVCIYVKHFFEVVRKQTSNKSCLPQLIKRWWKVHENNILRERPLTFDQSKIFFKNYKPITVQLCFAYKTPR